MPSSFRVGDWTVFPSEGSLQSCSTQAQLEPKVMGLLVYLSYHSDEVLSKERLIQAVWPDSFVADDVLTSAIWKLRQALGDDPRHPTYIRTLSRRGYQLVADVDLPAEDTTERAGRYQLDRKLGEGGMGEVYLAQDTELGRRLALKLLKQEEESDQVGRHRLRREARAAAMLDHPFICKIYDTGRLDGRDFIAMEYVEGEKLSARLKKGPLPVNESLRIGVEILEALETAHRRGIVHRDIKPSNVILTDQGHIKITDFGIAKRIPVEESGEDWSLTATDKVTSGTPAYMSPEQIRQEPVDHRTDLFLFGIVLYEMLTGIHPFRRPTRGETTAAILQDLPAPLSEQLEHPSAPLLGNTLSKLLAKNPQDRYQLAHHARTRLEGIMARADWPESTHRAAAVDQVGASEVHPYPGLAPFTSEQAQFFFGREIEVEGIWEKLNHSHLLGLIGPSGGGKSSFLHAGVAPSAPPGWAVVLLTPGNRPFLALAQALSGEFSGDPEAVRKLLRFDEPDITVSLVSSWRSQHQEALIVVDQFEELFTLNPREEQERFASLLGRLVNEANVRLLLSMRDDFLFHCHGFEDLEPVFSANLMPLGPLAGAALKQALVRPAERCGYGFEDQALIEEMLETVAGERGALPLLAFTAAELWQRRDREQKRLTRDAYTAIGGVAGAIAGHAEGTLLRIGLGRINVVRELFRNLTTARGTRALQSRKELLSVFGSEQQAEASEVLDVLLESRLLVSYRLPSVDQDVDNGYRIEIAHESLLTHWPRLVRWRTQEEDGARLRDELRQAARMWEQHSRSDDLLWSGAAVREYQLWRERYPGGVTGLEEEFGRAMTRHAQTRSRRKKFALATVLLLSLAAVIATTTLWRRSEASRLRAEAAHLMALAQAEADSDPTAAIAYATKSLELADTEVGRLFVTDVLTQGPIAFTREIENSASPLFSPDGKSLVVSGHRGLTEIWHSNGSAPVRLDSGGVVIPMTSFSVDGRYLWTCDRAGEEFQYKVWRFPDLTELKQFTLDKRCGGYLRRGHPDGIITFTRIGDTSQATVRLIPFEGDTTRELGTWPWPEEGSWQGFYFGKEDTLMVKLVDRELFLVTGLPERPGPPRKFGELQDKCYWRDFIRDGTYFATFDWSNQISIWKLDQHHDSSPRTFHYPFEEAWNSWAFDDQGHWLASPAGADGVAAVWDLTRPVSAGPYSLRRGDRNTPWVSVHPRGGWLATGDEAAISLWPLRHNYPSIMARQPSMFSGLALDPYGRFAAAASFGVRNLRLWTLETTGDERPRTLLSGRGLLEQVAVSPDGERIAVGNWRGTIFIVSVSDGSVQEVTGFQSRMHTLAFDDTGTRLAAAGGLSNSAEAVIRVWDLETGTVQVLDPGDGSVPERLQFGNGRLYSSGSGGLRSWDLSSGASQVLIPNAAARLSPDGSRFVVDPLGDDSGRSSDLMLYDLETGEVRTLPFHGKNTFGLAWHPSGEAILSTTTEGLIRIDPLTGQPPYRLAGHEGFVFAEFHPDGDWIISAGEDGTLRLWPMPDLSQPPFHALPYEELMARLTSMTNYRVVVDQDSPTGYGIEYGEFPDWEQGVPEW